MCIRDRFVVVSKTGKRRPVTEKLLRGFQDWTYAGWVVSESDGITPKTIRGNWEALVSTEDFEAGLVTVSYTHLDVYKRQCFGCFKD